MATLEASRPRTLPREGRFVNEPFFDFTREENARRCELPSRKSAASWAANTT